MELHIPKSIEQEVTTYGESSSLEVCGAFLGNKNSNTQWTCDEFIPMTNVSDQGQEVHYIPDPNELFQVLKKTTHMDKNAKKDLIGIFHTHPNNRAVPSITDLKGAGYMGFYMIYSPKHDELNTFYYDGGDPVFEPAKTIITA